MAICFTQEEDRIKFNALSKAVGIKEASRDFFQTNSIRTPEQVLEKLQSSAWDILNESPFQTTPFQKEESTKDSVLEKEFLDYLRTNNQKNSIAFADNMSQRLNIPYEVVSIAEAKRLSGKSTLKGSGFYKGGKVYLVEGLFNSDTAFHEFSHAIVLALAKSNPVAFQAILSEIPEVFVAELKKEYEEDYDTNSEEFKQEVVVSYLEKVNSEEVDAPKSALEKIMFHIKQFLRKIFGRKINLKSLSLNTKLSEFVDMLNQGTDFVFDRDLLSESDFVYLKKEYIDLKNDIHRDAVVKAQSLIDLMEKMVSNQLSSLKSETEYIQDIFLDNNRGVLEVMSKQLKLLKSVRVSNKQSHSKLLAEMKNFSEVDLAVIEKLNTFIHEIFAIDSIADRITESVNELATLDITRDEVLQRVFSISAYLDNYKNFLEALRSNDSRSFTSAISAEMKKNLDSVATKVQNLLDKVNDQRVDIVTEALYEHVIDKTEKADRFYKVQLDLLKGREHSREYKRLFAEYNGLEVSELEEYEKLKGMKDSNQALSNAEELRLEKLTEYKLRGYNVSKAEFKEMLVYGYGQKGSAASFFNNFMESYNFNQDTVTGGFFSYIQKNMRLINANSNSRQTALLGTDNLLSNLLSQAGYGVGKRSLLATANLGRAIGSIHDLGKWNQETEEFDFDKEWRFKSNYINYDHAYASLNKKLKDAKVLYETTNTDLAEKAFRELEEELFYFNKNFFHQNSVDEVVENQELLYKDETGRALRVELESIYGSINEIGSEIDVLGDADLAAGRAVEFRRLSQLKSTYDLNGNKKEGLDLEIAERYSEYQKNKLDFYTSTIESRKFRASYNNHLDLLNAKALNKDLFEKEMDEFLSKTTQISIDESYFELMEQLLATRSALLAPLTEINDKIKGDIFVDSDVDIDDMYDFIRQNIRPTRDEAGEYNGNLLGKVVQEKIRDMHELIDKYQEGLYTHATGGLTKGEYKHYMYLSGRSSEVGFMGLSQEQREQLNSYDEIIKVGFKEIGLSPEDIDEIISIDSQLRELSTPVYTNYYIDHYQKAFDENTAFFDQFKDFMYKFKGMEIESNYSITQLDIEDLLLSKNFEGFKDAVLSEDSEFTSWFTSNHYETERYEVYKDQEGVVQESLDALIYKSTNAWRNSIPRDADYYKTFELRDENGNSKGLLKDSKGRYRIPNMNFQARDLKPEYKTEVRLRDEVVNGELLLANVDHNLRWLPKDYVVDEDGNPMPGSALDNRFIDASYKEMFAKDRNLFDLMHHLKTWHLDNQEGVSDGPRLGLAYPKLRMDGGETLVRKGYIERKVRRMSENFGVLAADDAELNLNMAVRKYDETKDITTLDNKFSRPVSGVYDIPFTEVSTDLLKTLQRYQHSIQEHKVFNEMNAFTSTIEYAANTYAPNTLSEESKFLSSMTSTKNKTLGSRAKSINIIIERFSRNIQMRNSFDALTTGYNHVRGNDMARHETSKTTQGLNKGLHNLTSFMLRTSSRAWFIFNPIAAIGNYSSAQSQAIYKVLGNFVTNETINPVDFFVGHGKAIRAVTDATAKTYSVTTRSAQLQLLDILDASPDKYSKMQADSGGRHIGRDIAKLKFGYTIRSTSTHEVNYASMYAFMNNKKYRFKVNGKSTTLDKQVHLVNGRVETKPGVPKEFSITYNEKGDVVFGEMIDKLMGANTGFLAKIHGMAGKTSDSEFFSRTWIGQVMSFLFKFLPPMLTDKWGTKISIRNGKINAQRRFNWLTEDLERGTFLEAFSLLKNLALTPISGRNRVTAQNVSGMIQFVSWFLFSKFLVSMQYNLFFGGDSDDEVQNQGFTLAKWGGYSAELPAKMAKDALMKNTSAMPDLPWISHEYSGPNRGRFNFTNYLKGFALLALQRAERENNTWDPFITAQLLWTQVGTSGAAFGGTWNRIGEGFEFLSSLANSNIRSDAEENENVLLSGSDPSIISKSPGPWFFQEKDASKAGQITAKYYGFNGSLLDPFSTYVNLAKFNPRRGFLSGAPWDWNPFLSAPSEVEQQELEFNRNTTINFERK